VVDALNKRISVFLFKSMDTRKNQFISILACEDLPHVVQVIVTPCMLQVLNCEEFNYQFYL